MAKLVLGLIVFVCGSVVLLASGRSGSDRKPAGPPKSSPVMLAFSASARESRVSEVFVVHQDGSTTQLTHEGLRLEVAQWSPHASEILVVVAAPSGEALALVSATTGRIRLLRHFDGSIQDPAWSPTGDRIAFDWNGHPFTITPRGDDLRDLAPGALKARGTTPLPASGVSWAPDGAAIAVSATLACGARILVIGPGARSTNVSGACSHSHPDAYDDSEPAWSPTGREIAYTRRQRHHSTLYRLDLARGQPTRFRIGEVGSSGSPAWSPLASAPPLLAFRSTRGVYVYDPRRATATRLSAIAPISGAAWSADATRIAYLANRGTFNASPWLVIAGIHGGQPLRITDFSPTYQDPIGRPAWRPSTETG
jgi:Tol biopolymer transport system component